MNPALRELVEPEFDIAMHTDTGARVSNQDRVAYSVGRRGLIMAIADGLGGHDGGELASKAFVDAVIKSYESLRDDHIDDPNAFLVSQIIHAHRLIIRRAQADGYDAYSPKTTGVICLVQHGYAYIAHVGDSRLYHYRSGRLMARTRDHTKSEQMRREGLISEDDMRRAKYQTPLNRCIGGRRRSLVTLSGEFALDRGDLIVMCTDGIWRGFDERTMYQVLSQSGLESGIEELTRMTKKRFKQHCDNATTLSMRWTSDGPTQPGLNPPVYEKDAQVEMWRKVRQGKIENIVTQSPSSQSRSVLTREPTVPPGSTPLATEIAEVDRAISELEEYMDNLDEVV